MKFVIIFAFIVVCSASFVFEDDKCKAIVGLNSTGNLFDLTDDKKLCFKFCMNTKKGLLTLNEDNSINITGTLTEFDSANSKFETLKTVLESCQNSGVGITDYCTRASAVVSCMKTNSDAAGLSKKDIFTAFKHF